MTDSKMPQIKDSLCC